MTKMKYLVELASSTAVVLHKKFQQQIFTQYFPSFVRYFTVKRYSILATA